MFSPALFAQSNSSIFSIIFIFPLKSANSIGFPTLSFDDNKLINEFSLLFSSASYVNFSSKEINAFELYLLLLLSLLLLLLSKLSFCKDFFLYKICLQIYQQ